MFTGLLRNRGPVSIRRLCSATPSVVPAIAKVAANPYSVPLEYAGSRADKFLATRLAIPFSLAQKLLRTGQVRLQKEASKSRIDGAYKLAAGDVLLLPPSAAVNAPQQKQKVFMSSKEADELRSRILFLNDEVIVINKPAGVSTQGGTKTARHIDGMLDALQFDAPEAPRLVHRLDKDVSGCLVLARTKQAAQSLGEMFQKREDTITKVYWAALSGRPRALEGRIKMSLSREARMVDGVQKVVPEDDPSKSIMAITEYVERDNASKFASFVELYPMTGRKHQLRVHCASALHTPIIGDEKYGAGVSSHLAQALGPDIPLQLHSRAIVLPYSSGKGSFTLDRGRVRVEAPLPDHMVRVWNYFGWKTS